MAPARKAMTEEIIISFQDMETFLEPEEYQRFLRMREEVEEYNKKIAEHENKKAGAEWLPAPYIPIYFFREHDRYIELVRERKLKQLEKEARKQERLVASEKINPPLDAKKHLSEGEYQRFLDSIPGAIDAYLDGGKGCILNDWRFDRRASSYIGLTRIIKERKEERARHKRAELEYDQFKKEINDTGKKFRLELTKEKKPKFAYPPWLAGYQPNLWCEQTTPTQENIEKWAGPQIQERVPSALRCFISWELSWQVQMLPDAKYEVLGVSCLTWWFTVLILVKAHLRLVEKTFIRNFEGYSYKMKVDAEDLGSFYLGPVLGGHREGFSTPIALLFLLAKGESEAPGIEVVAHGYSSTTFSVQGFEEETVELHDNFCGFIIDMGKHEGLPDALLARQIIDQTSATLTKSKEKLPLPQLVSAEKTTDEEVVAALEAMGYKKGEIKAGMDSTHMSPAMSLEERVKAVLKNVSTIHL